MKIFPIPAGLEICAKQVLVDFVGFSSMTEDIRDKPSLNQEDVLELNFIRAPGTYVYRRHYRAGLRSHIMEVLDPEAVEQERKGVIIEGSTWYPRAEPLKMLRIFRRRFSSLKEAIEEVQRVKTIETFLGSSNIAISEEFVVDYSRDGKRDILLCGLQEYVKGAILDPWDKMDDNHLASILRRISFEDFEDARIMAGRWIQRVRKKGEDFVERTKKMISQAHHVPDLAGLGNLLVTSTGDIKLVDINNISEVSFDPTIHLDDRGYPVCDKSIEALSLIEQGLLGKSLQRDEPIYETYLDHKRIEEVKAAEEKFRLSMKRALSMPDLPAT